MKKYLTASFIVCISCLVGFGFKPIDNYFEISKNMEIFGNLYRELNTYYVDDIDPTKVMRTGIEAMLGSLDPYTNYISESQVEDVQVINTGQYSGVGIDVGLREGKLFIVNVEDEGPAAAGGLRVGDEVLSIDQEQIASTKLSEQQLNELLNGEQGKTVRLSLARKGRTDNWEVDLARAFVKVKNVPYYGLTDEGIGYIMLTGFTQDAGKEVAEASQTLKKDNPELKGIILDLRGNLGGRLDEAVNVTNVFVPREEKIVETRGRIEESNHTYFTRRSPIDTEIPLAVVINSRSASASEIVSGSIQDIDRGVIVGQRSYGKGLVQNFRPLSYNTQMKITIAKYYTPSGRCIQAIDYASRNNDGSVGKIPDSLRTAFKTRNGRRVLDGGGVEPDIDVEKPDLHAITRSLRAKGLIFDFATYYAATHESITSPQQFKVDDAIYNEFVDFIKKEGFSFESNSEKQLGVLEETLSKENYDNATANSLNALRKTLVEQKEKDVLLHKEEITDFIRKEILERYYFRKGLIEGSFNNDEDIRAAVKIILDSDTYQQILVGK